MAFSLTLVPILSSYSPVIIFSILSWIVSSMKDTSQYLPHLIKGNNFFIALVEYAPYSDLKGGNFLNASTKDSSNPFLVAKVFSAFSISCLSLTEYKICHKATSFSFDKKSEQIPAFSKREKIACFVSLHGYVLSST